MKNVMLGIISCTIVLYSLLILLSVCTVTERKNELDTVLASVMRRTMEKCYASGGGEAADQNAEELLEQEIGSRLQNPEDVDITVYACDMEKGILSVGLTEDFAMPGGGEKTIECRKTLIVDRQAE